MGSSPLTRGKLLALILLTERKGLIPAHAGKTFSDGTMRHVYRAHPRSRGENSMILFSLIGDRGSSPLTRGKPVKRWNAGRIPRLIPAHAGKTELIPTNCQHGKAHPRSRGENSIPTGGTMRQRGSSPLTRGKPREAGTEKVRQGLIPAHAGKTLISPLISRPAGAHPRSRGENIRGPRPRNQNRGSSPLTRGKHIVGLVGAGYLGLIPAHAGKTGRFLTGSKALTAHPRSRGENDSAAKACGDLRGSSPLTRGKHAALVGARHNRGLIPAHAGKTLGCRRG